MYNIHGRVIDAAGGIGLSGIAVCNGESITSTAADGSFSLEIRPDVDRHLFVTVPAGFRPGPGSYRSTDDLRPGPVEFALAPYKPSSCQHFICAHTTDMHVALEGGTTTPPESLRRDFSALMDDSSPDLVIASGDLTEWGARDQLHAVAESVGMLPCPWIPLFGGHDGNHERFGCRPAAEIDELKRLGKRDELLRMIPDRPLVSWTREFEAVFGPPYHSFDWGRWHFALFPNEAFHTPEDDDRKERWLWADLERQPAGRPVAVVVHTLPSPGFLDRLEQAGVRLVLHGHWHSSKVIRRGGMTIAAAPPLCFGGIDFSPRGYYRIAFDGDDFRIERRVLDGGEKPKKKARAPGLRWEVPLPGLMHRAAPVRCGDRILAVFQDPKHPGTSGVMCVDDRSGAVGWQLGTDNVVANRVAIDSAGNRGAVVTLPGRIHVFEIATGSVAWTAEVPDYPFRWMHPAPVIVGETLIAGARAGYGAWHLQTGEALWYRPLAHADKWPSYAGPAVWESLLILPSGGGLEAVDVRNGEPVWQYSIRLDYPYASPVVANGRVVHGGDWVSLHQESAEPAGLVVLDAATGEEVWNRKVLEASYPTGMAANKESIFVSTPHGEVQAYDMGSSALRWRHRFGMDRVDAAPYRRGGATLLADPVATGNDLVVGGCDGVVAVLDAGTGRVQHAVTLDDAVTAPVCMLDDGFCAGTLAGRLYCFDRLAGHNGTVNA